MRLQELIAELKQKEEDYGDTDVSLGVSTWKNGRILYEFDSISVTRIGDNGGMRTIVLEGSEDK